MAFFYKRDLCSLACVSFSWLGPCAGPISISERFRGAAEEFTEPVVKHLAQQEHSCTWCPLTPRAELLHPQLVDTLAFRVLSVTGTSEFRACSTGNEPVQSWKGREHAENPCENERLTVIHVSWHCIQLQLDVESQLVLKYQIQSDVCEPLSQLSERDPSSGKTNSKRLRKNTSETLQLTATLTWSQICLGASLDFPP